MNKAAQFLKDAGTFYLATEENGQPRVRPFGAVAEWDGKTYLCTGNKKKVYAQIMANGRVEISGMYDNHWIRLAGELAVDDRREARAAFLEQNPDLRGMYNEDDGNFAVLYFTRAEGAICSFTEPEQPLSL